MFAAYAGPPSFAFWRLVNRHLHGVYAPVARNHLVGNAQISGHERIQCALDLLLDQAAHFQRERAHRFEIGVELA